MKKNLFEMGSDFGEGWSSNNKDKPSKKIVTEILAPQKHQLHLEKQKRRGKVVTIVKPFHLTKQDLQKVLKTLKKNIGTGGTIREDSLEFQGDIPDIIRKQLEILEYRFKR